MPRTSRSLSSATLSLGLVAIPVGLHATRRREGRVSYHLVHATCGARVKRQYVCEREEIPVTDDELARAYDGDEGEAVVMSKDEAAAALPKTTGRIDLIEFVPQASIDPVYFDNAYYLSPGKGGDRAYHLLAETLRAAASVGVGTQLARGKSYLVAVRSSELGLVMHTLHHDEEVHRESQVAHGEAGRMNAAERELARSLVTQLTKKGFDPSKFEDEADKAMRKVIAAHTKVVAKDDEDRPEPGQMVDLLASLRASLEGKKSAAKRAGRTQRVTAKRPRNKRAKAARG